MIGLVPTLSASTIFYVMQERIRMETIFLKDEDVLEATKILKSGGIGIFPTDTVYGIGCDFLNVTSLKRLFEAKKRN